ncbi:hypothetical protein ACU5AX_06920 [Sphingomonas sp. XXL09]|uniref:hypothetical protein n=1 Tax=Sphingomonas sp. XXL09 TaxID=3457787 RepID=UPI00406BCDC8
MRIFSVILDDGQTRDHAEGHYRSIDNALRDTIQAAAQVAVETLGTAGGTQSIVCTVEDVDAGERRSATLHVAVETAPVAPRD